MLCADRDRVYGFGRKAKYRKWTVPLEFQLFAVSNQPKAEPTKDRHPLHNDNLWSRDLSIWVRAMFVTEDALYVCGPRDLYDEQQAVAQTSHFSTTDPRLALQQEHAEGKHGSIIKVFDKETGREISSLEIDDMPSWDGMITVGDKIVMTTVNGNILCFTIR